MSGTRASEAAAASPVAGLREAFASAAAALEGDGAEARPIGLERPPRAELGDYSTNAAMLLAPALEAPPREIAERLGERLRVSLASDLDRVEVAGPGFLNVFLADEWFCAALRTMRELGASFGADLVPAERRQHVLVEFVSANPTGPLTAAGGRHAAFGDALCRVLELAGHEVEREYYVNDYGTQVELFGRSIAAQMKGEPVPEGGYQGAYVAELAERMSDEGIDAGDVETIVCRGVELMVEQIRLTLARFRVRMDRFFSERSLHEDGRIAPALAPLEQGGHVYESEGASWLRTTAFGDDKDRVLRRSSDELTYFASDIAYHEDKRARGYDHLIDVWGADHHGYVARMKAAFDALGERDRLEFLIMQLVHVVERGERAQMSKRMGDFVTLDELIDDIGVNAARFFMLQRSHDTALDLDLDLAREHSENNPVYYVQYAHARISSILRNAGEERLGRALASDLVCADAPLETAERTLLKRLLELPDEVGEAAERRAPHRLTAYAHAIASDFHGFYRDCRVVGAEPAVVESFRLCLCDSTKRVIARVLDLLGVEAPERM